MSGNGNGNGKKGLRQIECSDVLWQTFLRMAEEQERSVSELVSDAMASYAQLSGYQTDVNTVDLTGEATPPPPAPPPAPPPPSRPRLTPSAPLPPSARLGRSGGGTPGPAGFVSASAQAAPPRGAPFSDMGVTAGPTPLYLVFANQKYRIDKDQFIIGRGAKSSDLPIKDGNISRKHAAVIRRNGTYFIKDLGSTNGIDFKGMRIDNKRIDEGDTFHLCDYELKFTYKR